MRQLRQRPELVAVVDGPELGALRDRHRPRLDRMLVADALDQAIDRVRCEPAVAGRGGEQLDPRDRLRRAALVDVQVGGLRADHRLPGPAGGAQREHVGGGPAPHRVRAGLLAELFAEAALDRSGQLVVAVAVHVADVGARDRREHVWVDRRRVVRGKAAPGTHCGASLASSVL